MQGVNKVGIRVYDQYSYHSLNGKNCIYYNKNFSIRIITYLKYGIGIFKDIKNG
jgi:hypothetical protein